MNNRAASGDVANGEIGTSSYQRRGADAAVYILGDAANDTDEFDQHVVVHEWGHYFEDQLSRADSVGGSHSLSSRLDPRVALGEGFGNALSGIVLDDPIYRDSSGTVSSSGFKFSLEDNPTANRGWFSEASVQAMIYDIADANADAGDTLSEGLAPIYNTLVDPDYVGMDAFTTVYAFMETMSDIDPALATGLDVLMTRESISGRGLFGVGETNAGGIPGFLPVYKNLSVGGPALNICSVDDAGTYNRIGNRHLLRLDLATAQSVTFGMDQTSGGGTPDPDFFLFSNGVNLAAGNGPDATSEALTRLLEVDTYVLDAHAFANVGPAQTSGDFCFDFMVN